MPNVGNCFLQQGRQGKFSRTAPIRVRLGRTASTSLHVLRMQAFSHFASCNASVLLLCAAPTNTAPTLFILLPHNYNRNRKTLHLRNHTIGRVFVLCTILSSFLKYCSSTPSTVLSPGKAYKITCASINCLSSLFFIEKQYD